MAYDFYITLKKLLIEAAIVALISALVYLADTGIPGLTIDYPQYSLILMTVAAAVRGVANWLKHKDDIEDIIINPDTNEIIS